MSDLISRKDALAYPLSWEHYDKKNGNRHFICGVESYREYIEYLPTIEPKRGRWIDPESPVCYKCSNCKCYTDQESIGSFYKFCPNCGARMDLE